MVGTHTHVQTADDRILPGGTAYITDVGMTGPHDGIIGVEREPALARFLNGMPARFETATGDPRLHAVVVAADPETGRATAITRLSLSMARPAHACGGRSRRSRGAGRTMTSLFDLPFEEPEPEPEPEAPLLVPAPEPARTPRDAVLTVSQLTSDIRHLLESEFARVCGRRRDLELPRLDDGPPLLHAEGRRRADPRR